MNQPPPLNPVWYYAHNGQSFGPFSQNELLQKAAEGAVRSDTLIVEQGGNEWKSFGSVDGLKGVSVQGQSPATQSGGNDNSSSRKISGSDILQELVGFVRWWVKWTFWGTVICIVVVLLFTAWANLSK